MLVTAEQKEHDLLKQQRIEEQNNYMRECFFAHLEGKKALTEQAKRKEIEEQREREIFNEHKLGVQKNLVATLCILLYFDACWVVTI